MNKELTPLEALDELHCVAQGMKPWDKKTSEAENIIEKELKALEIISKLPREEKQILLNAVYSQTKNEEEYELLKEELL